VNGIKVNDETVIAAVLSDGDIITIGQCKELVYRFSAGDPLTRRKPNSRISPRSKLKSCVLFRRLRARGGLQPSTEPEQKKAARSGPL